MIPERALRLLASTLCLTIALPAAAWSQQPAPHRQCIRDSSTASWIPYDEHTILVRSGGRSFRVTTNRCPGLATPLAHVIKQVPGGGPICGPHDVRLSVSAGANSIPVPCFAQSITPLTESEARALEARRR